MQKSKGECHYLTHRQQADDHPEQPGRVIRLPQERAHARPPRLRLDALTGESMYLVWRSPRAG